MSGKESSNLTSDQFLAMFVAGTKCVEANIEAINALNVFPVPDGDTGINMFLTLDAALKSSSEIPPGSSIHETSRVISRGALLGARGNSGVILSQFITGLSEGFAGCETCGPSRLIEALTLAAESAYKSVGKPVEGTMLTVMRSAAKGLSSAEPDISSIMKSAFKDAQSALEHTPHQLPILKEAGVVDSGGQGFVAFLAGAAEYLTGTTISLSISEPSGSANPSPTYDVSQEFLSHTADEMYGYCIQFIVHGDAMQPDTIRKEVAFLAGSTVVIGDSQTIRVHAHAEDPGPLVSLGIRLGVIDQVNIQNMDMQHQEFMAGHGYSKPIADFGVVVATPGSGLDAIFRDLGAVATVTGGQTMNPSAADFLEACKRANCHAIAILPNNRNVIMAAQQAAGLEDLSITVIPSANVPQGIAAMLALNPDQDNDKNLAAMEAALSSVTSGEVTRAVRETSINGVVIPIGAPIAILEGNLIGSCETLSEAIVALLTTAQASDAELVTIYYGNDVQQSEANEAASLCLEVFPHLEIEVVSGGQAHYPYLVSIE